jgi:hypothetical protein
MELAVQPRVEVDIFNTSETTHADMVRAPSTFTDDCSNVGAFEPLGTFVEIITVSDEAPKVTYTYFTLHFAQMLHHIT